MYDNQKQVDEIQKELSRISSELKIGGKRINGNQVVAVEIIIPIKGNSGVIKKLQELGWKKTWREKSAEEYHRGYASGRYKGYKMYQRMQLDVLEKE